MTAIELIKYLRKWDGSIGTTILIRLGASKMKTLFLMISSLSMSAMSAAVDLNGCDGMGLNKNQILEIVNRFEASEYKINVHRRYHFVEGTYHTSGCHYFFTGEARLVHETEAAGEAKVGGETKTTGEAKLDRIVHVGAAYVISKAGEVVSVLQHQSRNCVVRDADAKDARPEEVKEWLKSARGMYKDLPRRPEVIVRDRVTKTGCEIVYFEHLNEDPRIRNVFSFSYKGDLIGASTHR